MNYTLVTGGLGFIGSHTVLQLIQNNYNVIIVDNLSNSNITVFENIKKICNSDNLFLFEIDINNLREIETIFINYNIENIIHFASFKSVSESIQIPLKYYKNNIISTLNLLELCSKFKVKNFIFSSSATVYGNQKSPLTETSEVGYGITNPYGRTKYMIENILEDYNKSKTSTKIIILRYFNPVGAHASGLIGETPNGIPNNLMPYIVNVALKNNTDKDLNKIYSTLKIYGNNYSTPDGTCIRDFIHVEDLANAHIKSIEYLNNTDIKFDIFNVGTGKGATVLEIVNTFSKVNKVVIPYVIEDNRIGDIDIVYCDTKKSKEILKWEATQTLEDMCKDSYQYALNKH
jgi:UDP-glucose 4-epimerase